MSGVPGPESCGGVSQESGAPEDKGPCVPPSDGHARSLCPTCAPAVPAVAWLKIPSWALGVVAGSAPCDFHRWRGDYGGKKQLWFPSNYVEEMVSPAALEPEREVRPEPHWQNRVSIPRLLPCAHPPHTVSGVLVHAQPATQHT